MKVDVSILEINVKIRFFRLFGTQKDLFKFFNKNITFKLDISIIINCTNYK